MLLGHKKNQVGSSLLGAVCFLMNTSLEGGGGDVIHNKTWSTLTIFPKQLPQLLIIHILAKVLDVHIGELSGSGSKLSLTFFAGFEASDEPIFMLIKIILLVE